MTNETDLMRHEYCRGMSEDDFRYIRDQILWPDIPKKWISPNNKRRKPKVKREFKVGEKIIFYDHGVRYTGIIRGWRGEDNVSVISAPFAGFTSQPAECYVHIKQCRHIKKEKTQAQKAFDEVWHAFLGFETDLLCVDLSLKRKEPLQRVHDALKKLKELI